MKDNRKIAQILVWILIIISIMNLIALYSGYLQYDLLTKAKNGEYSTEEEATANDEREATVGIIQTIFQLTSIVLFFTWFRGAYSNLSKLGYRTKYSTNMAIWSFIIPIISLYRPYQIMNEIWFETQNLLKKVLPETKINFSIFYLVAWWALFIITNYVGNIAFKLAFKEGGIEGLINSTIAFMTSDFLDIPSAIITILLIRQVNNIEIKLYEANKLTGQSIIK